MQRPLRTILIILIIAAVLLQINFFTGAATTQSTVTIMPAQPQPPGPGPTPAPTAPAAVVPMPPMAPEIFYIGDFAINKMYQVLMGINENWIYTYKRVNYTITLVNINKDYAEFTVGSDYKGISLYVNQSVQIDSDLNGYADVRILLNAITNGKADVTLEIPFEEIISSKIMEKPQVYYLILILLALLVIDTIIHHRKAGHIFKHTGRVYR